MSNHSFWHELRRRHIYRVAAAYALVGWLLVEVATQVFPVFHMPDWAAQLVVLLIVLGFPLALVLAWAFEVTPEGVRRTLPAESPKARPVEQHRRVGRLLDFMIIGVLTVAVGVLAWRLWIVHPGSRTVASAADVASPAAAETAASAKSIAVLPFENLSAEKGNKYFADGMQDLILTKLADIGDLKVISRTSTMKYASHPDDLKTIAQQLGVSTILEGSVQKDGNQVLITVQLIDSRNDNHLWAETYQRTLDNVFGVEGEVASKIAMALKARLSPAESRRLATDLTTDDRVANDLFLRAEDFNNRGMISYHTDAFREAISLYRKAIARVPDFALARAKLSIAESDMAWFGGGGQDTAKLYADARTQAERALALVPDLPEGHVAIGFFNYYGKGDYPQALKAFDTALRIRPNDADALAAQGYVLRRQGRIGAAIGVQRRAFLLDPLNTQYALELGITFMLHSDYPEAESWFQRALALDPQNVQAIRRQALTVLFVSGNTGRALGVLKGDDPMLRALRSQLLFYQHRYGEALATIERIPDTADNFSFISGPKALNLADMQHQLGHDASARALYTRALAIAQGWVRSNGSNIQQAFVWSGIARAQLGLGHLKAGLDAVDRSQTFVERSGDQLYGAMVMQANAAACARAGRADRAVPLIAAALAMPGMGQAYAPDMLWIDPSWDPIRKSPAFQALLKKYAKERPASMSGV